MRPSALDRSDVEGRIRTISAAYPSRVPRQDLGAVEALRAAVGGRLPPRVVVVVGTNGKTTTSVFLGRLLRRVGVREGVTTSPHITHWGERVAIGGVPVADQLLLAHLERLHGAAGRVDGRETLRFFDLLTLAAADIFADAGIEVGVFEAGIGGRLDATRVLGASLTILTGVALDHVDLLGEREGEILREKLGVAPRGGTVLAAGLGRELDDDARAFAVAHGLELEVVRSTGSDFLARNADLACAAAVALGFDASSEAAAAIVADPVRGRMHRLSAGGVEVILDAAHNPQAWNEVAGQLPPSFVAIVSISRDRPAAAIRAALSRAEAIVATEAWPGRSHPADALAKALGGGRAPVVVEADPAAAFEAALEEARVRGVPLVVLGSTYFLPHAYAALGV